MTHEGKRTETGTDDAGTGRAAGAAEKRPQMRRRFASLFSLTGETLAVVFLVVVFFLVFFAILGAVFPAGTGLRELMSRKAGSTPAEMAGQKAGGIFGRGGPAPSRTEPMAAVVSRARNEVKSKEADAVAWEPAFEGLELHDHDAVQTMDRSSAVITFTRNNYLEMGENSLVIIRRMERDYLLSEQRSFLAVVDGELRGKLAGSEDEQVQVEVTIPAALARVTTKDLRGGTADFKISVRPDKSSTITVYQGEAEIVGRDTTLVVGPNESTNVSLDGTASAPVRLPEPVALIAPEPSRTYYYRDLPPRVEFDWTRREGEKAYHFMLARDPSFEDVVADEELKVSRFVHGNLKDGSYYWRVSALAAGGAEGPFSETGILRMVEDRQPPRLSVLFPPEVVSTGSHVVQGSAEEGAQVFVMGQEVSTEGGGFAHPVSLAEGVNVIVVEAVDEAGNVSYESRLINRKL